MHEVNHRPLVSVLTPCYNGANYIQRYVESLLSQNYENVQIIFMDDGSFDSTKEIILSYEGLFNQRGYSFEYHYHENHGQAYSVAEGLRYVQGDYLIWPDVDDYMPMDSITKKVDFLECHKDYGIVRTDYRPVRIETGDKAVGIGSKAYSGRYNEKVFDDYINRKNAWYQPGCFMIRMETFRKANPDLFLFDSRVGQNIQMLLPIFYHSKCGFIDEELYYYVLHSGSHQDEATKNYRKKIKSQEMEEECVKKTIEHMAIPDAEKYLRMNHIRSLRAMLGIAFEERQSCDARKYYNELRSLGAADFKCFIKGMFAGNPLVHYVIRKVRRSTTV